MTPRFGEAIENTVASPSNPRRFGLFVRSVRRTGRLNPGLWWQLTDGRGDFWQVRPESCRRRGLTDDQADPAPVTNGPDSASEPAGAAGA